MKSIIRTASAGSAESGDALVTVEPCGQTRIEVSSTLYSRFGQAIEDTAREVLREQGVENVKLTVDDHGALDWILRARLEIALERGGEGET